MIGPLPSKARLIGGMPAAAGRDLQLQLNFLCLVSVCMQPGHRENLFGCMFPAAFAVSSTRPRNRARTATQEQEKKNPVVSCELGLEGRLALHRVG